MFMASHLSPVPAPRPVFRATVLAIALIGLYPASVTAAQDRTTVELENGEVPTAMTEAEHELGFDLPPARLEPHEPPPFSYGPTINLGIAIGAFWLIQPGQPAPTTAPAESSR
jgi:hypothetical protein